MMRPHRHQDKKANILYIDCSSMISPIITLVVGPDLRLFAAYEHALLKSPYFAKRIQDQFYESSSKRLKLPDMYVKAIYPILPTHLGVLMSLQAA